jgi:hypothetical protein
VFSTEVRKGTFLKRLDKIPQFYLTLCKPLSNLPPNKPSRGMRSPGPRQPSRTTSGSHSFLSQIRGCDSHNRMVEAAINGGTP